jgi:hypothetical protein
LRHFAQGRRARYRLVSQVFLRGPEEERRGTEPVPPERAITSARPIIRGASATDILAATTTDRDCSDESIGASDQFLHGHRSPGRNRRTDELSI